MDELVHYLKELVAAYGERRGVLCALKEGQEEWLQEQYERERALRVRIAGTDAELGARRAALGTLRNRHQEALCNAFNRQLDRLQRRLTELDQHFADIHTGVGACSDPGPENQCTPWELIPSGHTPSGYAPSGYTPSGYTPSGYTHWQPTRSGHNLSGYNPWQLTPWQPTPSGHNPSHNPLGSNPWEQSTRGTDDMLWGHGPAPMTTTPWGHGPAPMTTTPPGPDAARPGRVPLRGLTPDAEATPVFEPPRAPQRTGGVFERASPPASSSPEPAGPGSADSALRNRPGPKTRSTAKEKSVWPAPSPLNQYRATGRDAALDGAEYYGEDGTPFSTYEQLPPVSNMASNLADKLSSTHPSNKAMISVRASPQLAVPSTLGELFDYVIKRN